MTLDALPLNVHRVIASVQADRAVAQRLMAMGFLPGAPVEVVQVAPFGDPITVELSGWRVSLRHSEARLILTRVPLDKGRSAPGVAHSTPVHSTNPSHRAG